MAAATRAIPRIRVRLARTPKPTPYIAPTIMWMSAPRMAGPAKNSKFEPPVAPFIDDIMSSGEMKVEAMWYSGVKNPEPW